MKHDSRDSLLVQEDELWQNHICQICVCRIYNQPMLCCLVTKLCPSLCNPIDCGPPGPSVHGISQARTRVNCHFLRRSIHAAAAAKSLQSRLIWCGPIDSSPPGSPIPGILQARTLEWVAVSFFNAGKWKVKVKSLSRVRPSATAWTAAFPAPPSMGFSRQEYWSGVPLPSPTDSIHLL